MASTRTLVVLVAGLGAVVALASGAQASSPAAPPPKPRAARPSTRRKPSAPSSSAPKGEVTLGPLTQVITDPVTGVQKRKVIASSLTPKEKAAYTSAAYKTGSLDSSDHQLLTPAQATALENESIETARATMPGVGQSNLQQELARRAAQKAREAMSPKSVPPIPKTPSNPTVQPAPAPKAGPLAKVGTPINLELARREAPTLAKHIRTKESNYSRQSVRDFQAHAGIVVDGIYGPLTQNALTYFGVTNAPKALFKAKAGTSTTYAPAN